MQLYWAADHKSHFTSRNIIGIPVRLTRLFFDGVKLSAHYTIQLYHFFLKTANVSAHLHNEIFNILCHFYLGKKINIKQKFNTLGIAGIILLFSIPVVAFVTMTVKINRIDESMRRYDLHRERGLKSAYIVMRDFAISYIATGMISIIGFIIIFIGRIYYKDK